MGTSSPYSSPSKADWTPLKTDITKLITNPTNKPLQSKVISGFVDAIGGASSFSSNNRIGRKGGSFSSSSARKTAKNIANFFSSIQQNGLEQTLQNNNLSNLKNKTADEIKEELVEYFSEPAITGDSIAARKAAEKTLDDLLMDMESIEDMENRLNHIQLESFIFNFFSHYINALFYRTFEEEYKNRDNFSPQQAAMVLKNIELDIEERIKSYQIDKNLTDIHWQGEEGEKIIQEILQESLELLQE